MKPMRANEYLTHKFVAVLNKKIPAPNLMNALGHMTAGLVAACLDNKVIFVGLYTKRHQFCRYLKNKYSTK